jgi:hypothetical protein
MTSLFVSHSSTDRTAANRVVERLAAEGYAAHDGLWLVVVGFSGTDGEGPSRFLGR